MLLQRHICAVVRQRAGTNVFTLSSSEMGLKHSLGGGVRQGGSATSRGQLDRDVLDFRISPVAQTSFGPAEPHNPPLLYKVAGRVRVLMCKYLSPISGWLGGSGLLQDPQRMKINLAFFDRASGHWPNCLDIHDAAQPYSSPQHVGDTARRCKTPCKVHRIHQYWLSSEQRYRICE